MLPKKMSGAKSVEEVEPFLKKGEVKDEIEEESQWSNSSSCQF